MKKIKRNKLISGGASESEGRWITKNGAHVFIKNKRLYEDDNEAPKMEQGGWFDGAGSEDEYKPLSMEELSEILNEAFAKSEEEAKKVFSKVIESGRVNLSIVKGLQDKHIEGTHNYNQEIENGRLPSILTANSNQIVKQYAGQGKLKFNKNGKWQQKESISAHKYIGINKNKRFGITEQTKNAIIHYSNKGVHIVPDKGDKKDD